jgi:hypothetical protein
VVTVISLIISLIMINKLINRGEKAAETHVAPAIVDAPAPKISAPAPASKAPAAEESDPKAYSGPLLR